MTESQGARRYVELSHVITEGLVTYPGLPAPTFTPFLTRADSRSHYAEGTEFAMDVITLIGNTGTYLDSPFHRYDQATDLAGLDLARLVDLPAVVVRVPDSEQRAIDATTLARLDVQVIAGAAVLLNTGGAARFATPEYAQGGGFLTDDGADWLIEHGAVLVGIDSVNIDSVEDGRRPAHSRLLAAEIAIVEHLTGLEQLPAPRRPVQCRAAAGGRLRHLSGSGVRVRPGLVVRSRTNDKEVRKMYDAIQLIGWVGAVLLLLAYGRLTAGKIDATGLPYLIINLIASAALGLSTATAHAWPSTTVNGLWLIIGLVPLTRSLRARRSRSAERAAQVGQQVGDVLDADREANQIGAHA